MEHGGAAADMADFEEQTEKISLGSYVKKHAVYGSMSKENAMKPDKYIKHVVQPGDTFQGLALRYGVTVEQIKRANKMWTSDSLFLKATLDIPAPTEELTVSSMSPASQSPQISPIKKCHNGENELNCEIINISNQLCESAVNNNDDGTWSREESAVDFLIRIDSHIAQTKDKVLKFQNKVVYSEDDLHNSRDGYSGASYQYQRSSLTNSSSLSNLCVPVDPSALPQAVVMTKGRKVRSSLKKLEKQQDEIFEL